MRQMQHWWNGKKKMMTVVAICGPGILMNPTFELRSSRKDKYPLHGLKLYKMVNGKFMGVAAIWEVRIVHAWYVNMSAVNFGREWRLFYRPEVENM